MVRVRKKTLKGKTYYYLVHSVRTGSQVRTKELYLGSRIPKDIEKMKKEFLSEIYHEKWFADIEKIRQSFSKSQRLMPKSVKEKELETFAINFTYDTQRIEGSSLTLKETMSLLERGIAPHNKPMRDVHEAQAHRDLFFEILESKKDLSLQLVLEWHWKLFGRTKAEMAGKIRKYQVSIRGSKFVPPSPVEVYPMLVEFFRWYNKNKNRIHPVELAAIAHLKFVTIHPFGDGNGRISRLMMNFILHRKKYPMFDISYGARNSYYNALEQSNTRNEDRAFLQWFVKRYIKEHSTHLR